MINITDLSYLLTLPRFEHLEARTIDEAFHFLSKHKGKARVIAGGTDLLVLMRKGRIAPRYIVNIKAIPNLDYIDYNETSGLKIGALATLQSLASSSIIKDKFGMVGLACNKIATPQIRNMGTIGGNICTGGPSQDLLPSLLVLDAQIKLVSQAQERFVPIQEFLAGPFQTTADDAEILTEIQIPNPPTRSAGSYQWHNKITTVDETLVGVAVLMTLDPKDAMCKDIKIGLCSVAPTAIRARKAEELLRGRKIEEGIIEQAAQAAVGETSPRSRADYRKHMTRIMVKQVVNEVWQKLY